MNTALGRHFDGDAIWAEVWPSAVGMANEIVENPEWVKEKTVYEIGSGIGVAGIAAAIAGAQEVTISDREPRALYCGLLSAQENGVHAEPLPAEISVVDGVSLPHLPSNPSSLPSSLLRAEVLDWYAEPSPKLAQAFDVVLLCDVLFEASAVPAIARHTCHLLKPEGIVLLGDATFRAGKEGLRKAFIEKLFEISGREMYIKHSRHCGRLFWSLGCSKWRKLYPSGQTYLHG
ncbi:hypothetical protein CYMTET_32342 [Cymbomonas tetramitiformis]|uniref:Uncharacterized protein n=1 Tax=Cymbomonas tetramitiformis TaxID=36881 RepID=A0AAE0KSA9_9CHLO|nr:hypothetical protein CYMTET_32342 [Cymbomonas tetramitiformis]